MAYVCTYIQVGVGVDERVEKNYGRRKERS